MRDFRAGAFVVIGACALLGASARAASAPKSRVKSPAVAPTSFYALGMSYDAEGNPAKALSCFREALREQPRDHRVRAALRRAEGELAAARSAADSASKADPSWLDDASDALDELVLVDLPQVVNFDDTLGGGESAVGALAALNGRVAQLLGEQRFAREHDRRFGKDRELRSLLRRLPAVVA